MIKAILFDWGNVFATSTKDRERRLDIILKPFGFTWKKFFPYWWQFYILRSSGEIKTDKVFENYIKRVIGKNIPVKGIIKTRIECQLIPKDHIEVIKELKSRNYKVGVLSNHVEEWLKQTVKKYKMENLFDCFVVSSKVGKRKPDAVIYYEALKVLKVNADEVIFIADEVSEDLVTASGLKMKTIWYDDKRKRIEDKNDKKVLTIYKPDAIIGKLQELSKVVDRL